MARSIWELFVSLFREDEEKEESRFVPSPLDLSVRVGHGGNDGKAARELSKINKQAQELEERRRGN